MTAVRRSLRAPHRLELALWVLPVVAFLVVRNQHRVPGFSLELAAGGILGVGAVIVASRRPDRALLAIVAIVPFQGLISAWLYARGTPLGLVRAAGYWKEAAVAGVILAAWGTIRATDRRPDRIDIVGLAFIAFVAAYAIAPRLFSAIAPTDLTVRYVGFRQVAGFAVVALAARHAPLPAGFLRRLATTAVTVAAATAAVAVYEMIFSDSWNDFIVDTVQLPRYLEAIEAPLRDPTDVRIYSEIGGREILRVSSVMVSLSYGFYLLPALGLLVAWLGLPSRATVTSVGAGLVGAALLMTQTRSAIVGGVVAVVVIVFGSRQVHLLSAATRERMALLLVAAVLIALPAMAAGGLFDRFQGAATGEDQAQEQHRGSIDRGFSEMVSHPIGHGLGTTAGTGQRFGSAVVVADNSYLQIGNEVGVVPMLLFVGFVASIVRQLRSVASVDAVGVRAALLGTLVGAFFLPAWMDIGVSWTAFALIGVALAPVVAGPAAHPGGVRPDGVVTAA